MSLDKTIEKVEFPTGNVYEGSPCIIYWNDGTKQETISDTAYMYAMQSDMSKVQMEAVGL